MTGTVPIDLAVVVLCVVLSAFFSSSEAAFLSIQRTARLAHLVQEGVPTARRVSRMLEDPGRLLSTILLGNNLVNVAFTAIITALILDVISDQGTGIVVATVAGTVTLLILGEVIPKTVAVRFPMGVAMLFTRPLKLVELAFWPIVVVLQWASRVADIGRSDGETDASITEEELRSLIDIGEAEGEFDPGEADRLERVFRFGDRQVREVMTPRTEIVFVERGATLEKFLSIYRDHSHTRFPVFKESTDNIVGILSSKDILRAMSSRSIPHGPHPDRGRTVRVSRPQGGGLEDGRPPSRHDQADEDQASDRAAVARAAPDGFGGRRPQLFTFGQTLRAPPE